MPENPAAHRPIDPDPAALDFVSARIAERYGHPARTAYLYLFRLYSGSNLDTLIPIPEQVIAAWMDEGSRLAPAAINEAIAHCQATLALKPDLVQPQKLTPFQRRQRMARSVVFSVKHSARDLIEVELRSRSLTFTPKGDRAAHEQWHPSGDIWFSAYQPQPE